jgi:hypothetical protein
MDSLVEELRAALAAAFASEQYRQRREAIVNEVKARPCESDLSRRSTARVSKLVCFHRAA